jgi:hypothetical protein
MRFDVVDVDNNNKRHERTFKSDIKCVIHAVRHQNCPHATKVPPPRDPLKRSPAGLRKLSNPNFSSDALAQVPSTNNEGLYPGQSPFIIILNPPKKHSMMR